ncbi:uncharacterized protein LOC122373504 isoform X2 [Amphibalanus amphitrite]|nr:uncharacterized protein LOC122373504 isoform X2 [Amphibalanus amphitrite]XP_043207567.1 uncharacterized protein LOC122373504 isoform X2 [Amphibalanus amphitrite]XP_043207568.1 uncharacterized protein LOC122373504 isoform X2 [Amphibalanus amphitrite]
MPGKRPGQRKFQAKAKNSKGTARHKQGYIPISSATGLPAVPQSSNEQGLDTIVVNTMATDEHALGQTWSQRQEAETENWDGARGPLYDNALSAFAVPTGTLPCVICGGVATVVCRNCPSSVLCTKCDVDQHTLQPFHKRRHWTRQFWEVLPARSSVTQAGEFVQFDPVLPLHEITSACCTCTGKMQMESSSFSTTCITMQGRYNLLLPVWTCASCKSVIEVTNSDLMRCGFYRASPIKMSTVVHEDVFVTWQSLKYHSPGTSLTAFVASLEELGKSYGSPGPVDFERLEKAYTEWTCMQFELQRLVCSDFMACEACGDEPKIVHVDGNFKLYRYQSSGSGEMTSAYHLGTLIEDKEAVDSHFNKTKIVTKTNNRCGISSWAAGRNAPGRVPSKKTQDETGLIVATCRHSVILGGVNMYRGELFAYSHYLQQKRFPNGLQYFASDIVCKYWPWTQRVGQLFPEHATHDTKPFLSVMHAMSHAYYCQIAYGGFWQEGSGWSVMETTEMANAFLSRASNTTKYMTSAQRVDSLTDLVLCYNRSKHLRMPELLVKRKEDAKKRLPSLEKKLASLLQEHGVDASQIDVLVEQLHLLATSLSMRDRRASGTDLENAIEMTSDSWRVRRSAVTNVATSSKARIAARRRMQQDHIKLKTLLAKYAREAGVTVAVEDAQEGCFPWHTHSTEGSSVSLSAKRVICDTVMRIRRTREEVLIVDGEMERLLSASSGAIHMLKYPLAMIEEQLSRPDHERESVLEPSSRTDRYSIRQQSTSVLRGLRSLILEALSYRQEYLNFARSRFQQNVAQATSHQ